MNRMNMTKLPAALAAGMATAAFAVGAAPLAYADNDTVGYVDKRLRAELTAELGWYPADLDDESIARQPWPPAMPSVTSSVANTPCTAGSPTPSSSISLTAR
jgi:hypothetical protein